jgi:flagellar biogenesis protein FliO
MACETIRAVVPARSRFLEIVRRGLARLRPPARKLRLCESLSLGERRTLAIVQFESTRFLVGATPASVTLLRQLPDAEVAGMRPCPQEGGPCEP